MQSIYVTWYIEHALHAFLNVQTVCEQANLQAKRAQEAKAAAEELLSAANEAAASAANTQRSRLTSSDVPLSPSQARHNSLAEGSQHATALSALTITSSEDIPGGVVTGLEPTTLGSPLGSASPTVTSPTVGGSSTAKLELNSDSREFLIRLERELIATGTNFNADGSCKSPGPLQPGQQGDALRSFDAANAATAGTAQRVSQDKASAELLKLLHIDESELGKTSGQ